MRRISPSGSNYFERFLRDFAWKWMVLSFRLLFPQTGAVRNVFLFGTDIDGRVCLSLMSQNPKEALCIRAGKGPQRSVFICFL